MSIRIQKIVGGCIGLSEKRLLKTVQGCTKEKFTLKMLRSIPRDAPENQISLSIRPLLGKHLLMNAATDVTLGVGRDKYVHYAIDLESGEKEILFVGELLAPELFFLKKLKGAPEFVQMKTYLMVGKKYYIITQYCNRGDWLQEILTRTLSFQDTLRAAEDVARGVEKIHKQEIVHRDLKLNNLFIHKTEEGVIHGVIGDFNFMDQKLYEDEEIRGLLGVAMQVSPERAKQVTQKEGGEKQYIHPVKEDIWMLGLSFFYWFKGGVFKWHQGLREFADRDQEAIERCAKLEQSEFSEEIRKSKLPPFLIPLIESMLQIDPEKRATASTVHSYLVEISKVVESV